MSALLIALLFAAGAGVWVYTKLQGRTSGNGGAAKAAAAVFVLAFIVLFTLAHLLLHN